MAALMQFIKFKNLSTAEKQKLKRLLARQKNYLQERLAELEGQKAKKAKKAKKVKKAKKAKMAEEE